MKLIRELIDGIRQAHPTDTFFQNFERELESWELKRTYYSSYNNALRILDKTSWQLLKQKAIKHYFDHRPGQLKQGMFNQLNEAFAYSFLVRRGYSDIHFVPEDSQNRRPDLTYHKNGVQRYCEVKTICVSKDEIGRREDGKFHDRSVYQQLSKEFLRKLGDHLCEAQEQIALQGSNGLVYVVVRFDDFNLTNYPAYRKQLVNFLYEHPVPEVFMRMEICGARRIYKKDSSRCNK